MNKNTRKPIPKSQKEISVSLQNPLETGGVGFQPTGNPNSSVIDDNNRGNQISFDNDNTKPIYIGLEDIDSSIFYYFNNVIKPFVIQDNQRIPVPVIYGSQEKWKSFQKDGYYRDANGKIMMPLIMVKRNEIQNITTIGNKLDANFPYNVAVYQKKYSPKNAYDNFNILNNVIPQKTTYAVVIPDYVRITYDCIVRTYYMHELNKIVEAINYTSNSYWGDPNRFKFKARIDSFGTKTELLDNDERIVSSNFNIILNGYVVPDNIQKDVNSIKKLPDITKVTISEKILGETERIYYSSSLNQ